MADIIRLKLSLNEVSSFCVLVALCRPEVAFTANQLKSFPLTEKGLLQLELDAQQSTVSNGKSGGGSGRSKRGNTVAGKGAKALAKYCVNKTARAKEGKVDPIIGRDREIQEISKILGRRSKPNVIIIGEPGVGKTALVEGFAQRMVEDKVPTYIAGAELFELDMGSLIAGASYKGEIEDRLKSIIREIKEYEGKAILFIDEIHILMDPKGGAAGAANLLKPELARGELTVIGATTFEEYRKYIEKDDAFKRRFDVIEVDEPDFDKALRMLKYLKSRYEEHHKIDASDAALASAVGLAMRYFRDRQLPDSSIDLLDRTMASAKMMKDTTKKELEALSKELKEITVKFSEKDLADYQAELVWFDSQIRDRISDILLGKIKDLKEVENIDTPQDLISCLLYTSPSPRDRTRSRMPSSA